MSEIPNLVTDVGSSTVDLAKNLASGVGNSAVDIVSGSANIATDTAKDLLKLPSSLMDISIPDYLVSISGGKPDSHRFDNTL